MAVNFIFGKIPEGIKPFHLPKEEVFLPGITRIPAHTWENEGNNLKQHTKERKKNFYKKKKEKKCMQAIKLQ